MPRLRIGSPLKSAGIIYESWNSIAVLDERSILRSVATGLILACVTGLVLFQSSPESLPLGSPTWVEIGLFFLILSVGHEVLHLLAFPRLGLDANTVAGLWLECCSPYVQYTVPMQRNRFLLACVMPFMVLTLVPVMLVMNGTGSIAYLSWLAVLNSIGVGSDILILSRLLASVPANAWVLENGEDIRWSLMRER